MKAHSYFTVSLHIQRDSSQFRFSRPLLQRQKLNQSEFQNLFTLENRNQNIRRKSCYCNECGQMSKFQYKYMNLKHYQKKQRKTSNHIQEWTKNNRLSITIPNMQQIRKSQASFRISRKQLLNEKSDDAKSPLMIYDNSFARSSVSTTQRLLEDTAQKNKLKPSVFHSHDGPSPIISSHQIVDKPLQTERSTQTKIRLRNNPKLLCPLLMGLSKKTLSFQKIQAALLLKFKHSRIKTQ